MLAFLLTLLHGHELKYVPYQMSYDEFILLNNASESLSVAHCMKQHLSQKWPKKRLSSTHLVQMNQSTAECLYIELWRPLVYTSCYFQL